jgi:exoribonuclease-2
MREEGFAPDFPPEARREAEGKGGGVRRADSSSELRDLRDLLWSSVDNPESRDLDQIEWAERLPGGEIRLLVGIADVDALVPKGSAIDRQARQNAVTVYAGVHNFSMIPEVFSTGLTSLLPDEDRRAVVTEMRVDGAGEVTAVEVYPALVRNREKLAYGPVGEWLENPASPLPALAATPGLKEQLLLQAEASGRLGEKRRREGSLELDTVEAQAVIREGKVVDLETVHRNRARSLIENLMIAANTSVAGLLLDRGIPAIQRVVREPERWPRIAEIAAGLGEALPDAPDPVALSRFLERRRKADPDRFPDLSLSIVKLLGPGEYTVVKNKTDREGHFGLAAPNYSHSTAPNRRYVDLVMQRLIKAAVRKAPPPYSVEELEEIAAHCTERENAARKVERAVKKAAAAVLLSDRIGDVFDAIVTGVPSKGTFARVVRPPVEGRIMQGERGLDVGDRVRVRLLSTDPERGYIDFARA